MVLICYPFQVILSFLILEKVAASHLLSSFLLPPAIRTTIPAATKRTTAPAMSLFTFFFIFLCLPFSFSNFLKPSDHPLIPLSNIIS